MPPGRLGLAHVRFHHHIATASSRRHSDDRVVVIERRHALVIAIADGAGGMRGGAAASDTFIRAVEHDVNDDAFDVHDSSAWRALLGRVDHDLARVMTKRCADLAAKSGR